MKIRNIVLFLIVSSTTVGCTGIGTKDAAFSKDVTNVFADQSALSVLGVERLGVLELGDRETAIIEKSFQAQLSEEKLTARHTVFPRLDDSMLNTYQKLGKVYVPKAPLGLKCRTFSILVELPEGEILRNNGVMCLDTIDEKSGWKRELD